MQLTTGIVAPSDELDINFSFEELFQQVIGQPHCANIDRDTFNAITNDMVYLYRNGWSSSIYAPEETVGFLYDLFGVKPGDPNRAYELETIDKYFVSLITQVTPYYHIEIIDLSFEDAGLSDDIRNLVFTIKVA